MNLVVFVTVSLYLTKTCFSYGIRRERTLANPLWNETVVDRLRNDLLTNYDKFARPGHHQEPISVMLGFGIYYLETDEMNSTFSVAVGLRLTWTDPKFIWNPDDYDGLRFVTMADHEIWQPDLYLLNSASSGGEAIARYSNALAVAHSNGVVLWVTPLRFTALCQFDLFYWPYDTQHCQLKFGSWSRSSRDLQLLLDKVFYESSADAGQWNITSSIDVTSVPRDLYSEFFHQVVLSLTLVRKPSTIATVVTATVASLAVLVLLQQLVVVKNNDNLVVPCFVSTGTCLCLLYFSTKIKGAPAPWVLSFFSACLFLTVLSLLKLIVLKHERPVNWITKAHLQGKLGRVLFLNDYISNFGDHAQNWDLLATAIDRIFFLSYSFVFIVLFLVYLV